MALEKHCSLYRRGGANTLRTGLALSHSRLGFYVRTELHGDGMGLRKAGRRFQEVISLMVVEMLVKQGVCYFFFQNVVVCVCSLAGSQKLLVQRVQGQMSPAVTT